MKPWSERPFEVRNLFNPAFCALVLARAFQGYDEIDPDGMPFSLSLLVLPLCLHKNTREVIMSRQRSYFLKTLSEHPEMLIGLGERVSGLMGYTLEGLGYALSLQLFTVSADGRLKSVRSSLRKTISGTRETVECQKAAKTVAEKFAEIGDRVTIYASLGIRP